MTPLVYFISSLLHRRQNQRSSAAAGRSNVLLKKQETPKYKVTYRQQVLCT